MSSAVENQAMIAQFAIKVEGTNVAERVYNDLLEIVVESTLNMPDMATIKIHDAEFHWIDDALFTEGKRIEIQANNPSGQLVPVFKGEIVGVEMDLSAIGSPSMTVRCFDKSHRLHRGRKARSFLNVKDSDLVTRLAQEAGLRVTTDQTAAVHEWLLQNNQTNWEFLVERAAMNGYRLYCEDGDHLKFQKMERASSSTETELSWGEALRSFRIRTSTHTQVDQVQVRAWDCLKKDVIVADATTPKAVPEIGLQNGPSKAKSAFGPAKMVVVDRPFPDASQAKVYAESICDDMGGTFVDAEGLCYGQPAIRSGSRVKISNIGTRFSGKYFVTSATHTYTAGEGYSTLFVVSGKRTQSLLGLVDREDLARRRGLGSNPVIGIVTNNEDPENLNRVKVKYPWLTEEHESFWARSASQMAGTDRGFYSVPEVNDEVLVVFEHGDITRPIIVGALWNRKDKAPDPKSKSPNAARKGGLTNRRGFRSRKGSLIELDDTDGDETVALSTQGGHVLYIRDNQSNNLIGMQTVAGHGMEIRDTDDKILIRTKSNHAISLDQRGGMISVKNAAGNEVKISDSGSIEVKAIADIKLSAPNITIDATVALNLKGTTVNVDGNGLVKIQAPMVNIN